MFALVMLDAELSDEDNRRSNEPWVEVCVEPYELPISERARRAAKDIWIRQKQNFIDVAHLR